MSFATIAGQDYVLSLAAAREEPVGVYYVALCFNEPGITTGGGELDEVEGLGYARGELVNVSGNWDVIHSQLTNQVGVIFPLADEDWGQVRYWAICDAIEAGRVFWAGEFSEPMYIGEGDQVEIPEQALALYFGEEE